MCAVLFFPLGFNEAAQKLREDIERDGNRWGKTMCAVVFFPLGFNEAAHKDGRGYLQRN